MKKSTRRILTIAMSLVLVCILSISAFAINEPTEAVDYEYDDVVMWHTVIGYAR